MDKKTTNEEEVLKLQKVNNNTDAAAKAAEADIEKDLDLTPPPDPANDLDEGEMARLEGED